MVAESYETKTDLIVRELRGGGDLVADITDGLSRGLDIWALAACCVLQEDHVTEVRCEKATRWKDAQDAYSGLLLGAGSAPS